ncbi:MAG: ABC transporter permease [Holosporales bacterium]|jgi:ABC-2 type transport system permease protein|nr:ABC transporter permease [Holosporales bacterium]
MILPGFIKKELIQTLRDPHLAVMILLAPVLQILLFGFALTNDVVNIRLGASFAPGDVVAADIYNAALASKRFIHVDISGKTPEGAVHSGVVDAVIVAPQGGLTRWIGGRVTGGAGVGSAGAAEGTGGELQLLIDASNVVRAVAIDGFMQGIVQKTCFPGMTSPLKVVVRTLYNPTLETTTFTVPGVMAMILMVLVMILTCTSIAKEKESGTFETIISAPIKRRHIIIGKTLPFAIVGLFNTLVILAAGRFFFDLPFRGNAWMFALENLLFVICSVMVGILLSTFVKNQQQSMLCCFFVIFILMMLSGSFFPIENMPKWLQWIAYMNPMAHHTLLIRNILLKGGNLEYVVQHLLAIFGAGVVLAILAFRRFRITLN